MGHRKKREAERVKQQSEEVAMRKRQVSFGKKERGRERSRLVIKTDN